MVISSVIRQIEIILIKSSQNTKTKSFKAGFVFRNGIIKVNSVNPHRQQK